MPASKDENFREWDQLLKPGEHAPAPRHTPPVETRPDAGGPLVRQDFRLAELLPVLDRGDLLLFRGFQFIARPGRGLYSHAALFDWFGSVPYVLETRAWYGARAVTLASQVERYPGVIDVYRPDLMNRWLHFSRHATCHHMRLFAGRDYGWTNVLLAGLRHTPFVRWFLPVNTAETDAAQPPFCSMAVSAAYRAGGVDPVPGLSDRLTEPNDLARSAFFTYLGTLIP